MRKTFVVLIMLLGATLVNSQGRFLAKKLINGEPCQNCEEYETASFTEHLNFAILGARNEYVRRTDTLEKLNGIVLKNLSRHAFSSPDILVDFIPSVTKKIPFHKLEFQLLLNKELIQGWKSVTLLPEETDYRILCTE